MSDIKLGQIISPTHCQVSISPDRKKLALTFYGEGQARVSIVLPILGAAGLQAKLARCLFALGVRRTPPATEAAAGLLPTGAVPVPKAA